MYFYWTRSLFTIIAKRQLIFFTLITLASIAVWWYTLPPQPYIHMVSEAQLHFTGTNLLQSNFVVDNARIFKGAQPLL